MERFTHRQTPDKHAYVDIGKSLITTAWYSMTDEGCRGPAIDRLADYEDTGLEPQEVKDMHNELCLKCGNYQREHLGACNGCRWRKEENQ